MNTHIVLTIDKEGDLPIERERHASFTEARHAADLWVDEGKYAAGAKLLYRRRPVLEWCYLNCDQKKHGPTIPEMANRRPRKGKPGPALPMQGNPVGDSPLPPRDEVKL